MPLIVFIETVGISQIKKNSLWYLYWQKRKFIKSLCNLSSPNPNDHIIMRPIVPLFMYFDDHKKSRQCCPLLDLKKAFLLFVVFIQQLPMVCVTFSEKSYSVHIHTYAPSKSLPLLLPYQLRAHRHSSPDSSLVFKQQMTHMYTLAKKNELTFIWIWQLLI